jgi:phosphoglycerate dehydrogenase-like enzyme
VDVLLTEVAFARDGGRLTAAAPEVGWLRMEADGRLHRDGVEVARDEAAPEVAWGTGDLFDDGPMRPFLGLVARAPSLRWFASPAAGFDHPFFGDLVRKGIRVTTSHASSPSIAEYVLRAVLDAFQGADQWRRAQADRVWRTHDRHREVAGSTWLVIGLGAIGSEVARRARALGATVIGVRRSPAGNEPVDEVRTPDRVAEVLGRAHAVVLSAPATPATRHLVDAAFLVAMKPRSVLVNVARGDLVDEAALLAALDTGTPGLAVLDVTATEPLPPESPLWTHPAVVVTPHSSGRGLGRFDRAVDEFLDNLARYRRGEPLRSELTLADLP